MQKILILSALLLVTQTHAQTTTITPELQEIKSKLNPTANSAATSEYLVVNNKLYFNTKVGNDDGGIWVTDGTTAGTQKLITVTNSDILHGLTPVGNNVVYLANLGLSKREKSHLYVTDGTIAGSHSIANNVLVSNIYLENSRCMAAFNGKAYFAGDDGVNGVELWETDGTDAGTKMVKDIIPGPDSSKPTYLTNFKGKLFFLTSNNTNQYSLYATDGTNAGTTLMLNMSFGSAQPLINASSGMYVCNGKLYFSLYDGSGNHSLFVSDGTAAGTTLLKDFGQYTTLHSYEVFNNNLYFVTSYGTSGEFVLWKTDGTPSGTTMLLQKLNDIEVKAFNGKLYISTFDHTTFTGTLQVTATGSVPGTILLQSTSSPHYPKYMTACYNKLFFVAPTVNFIPNIFSTDGTPTGTVMAIPPNPGASSYYGMLTSKAIFRDSLYFEGCYDLTVGGRSLYKLHLKVTTTNPNTGITTTTNDQLHATLYPMPTNNYTELAYNVSATGDVTINVVDMTGKLVYNISRRQLPGVHKEILNLAAYPTGTYIVNIKTQQKEQQLKLIVN